MAPAAYKEKKLSLASSHSFEQDSHAHSILSLMEIVGQVKLGGEAHPHVPGSFFYLFPLLSYLPTEFCLRNRTINEMVLSA